MPRHYVQQSDGAPSWKTLATAPSRQGAQSQSRSLQKAGYGHTRGPGKRYVRAMSRSALLCEGGVDACICAETTLKGLSSSGHDVGLHLDYVAGLDMNIVSRRAGSVVGSPPLPSARPVRRG